MFNKPPTNIRIAILDDHPIVRFGVAARLESEMDFHIVGNYETSQDMIQGLQETPADILLIDYSLGPVEIDGISLIRALRIKYPDSHVIVLSSHYTPATVSMTMQVGARGFVGKCQDLDNVVQAIRRVVAGGTYLDEDMKYRLPDASQDAPSPSEDKGKGEAPEKDILPKTVLSPREREVIRCYLDGLSVSEIAEKFGRSIKTISTQKSTAFRKLGVTSDNELFKLKHMVEKSRGPAA